MIRYTVKTKKIATRIIGTLSLIFLVILGSIIPLVLTLVDHAADFTREYGPDPATFIPADYDQLASTAYSFDDRFVKFHMPLNLTSGGKYTSTDLTEIDHWYYSDNEALFTGITFAGWVYKYLAALNENNQTMADFAENTLLDLTTGLAHLVIVPNGGLGPEYGAILGRGYAPPEAQSIAPYLFEDTNRHFNGSGDYSQWRWRGYTSNDEHGGYYLFLALAVKYLMGIEFINRTVSLIVDQFCNGMIQNNFLGIHGTGALTGVDQKPIAFLGGFWIALLLKMGSICHPQKYTDTYHHFVANEMLYLSFNMGEAKETIANYYAYNFGSCVCLGYLLLEGVASEIGRIAYSAYENTLWAYSKNNRNAWLNAIFLMIAHEYTIEVADLDLIIGDVEDQLMRYADSHFPDVRTPQDTELPEGYWFVSPLNQLNEQYNIPAAFQSFIGVDQDDLFLNRPLTCEYMHSSLWMWDRNPFRWDPEIWTNLRSVQPGISYTVPYWMLRYCSYILPEVA